jgi:hypothetical protein
MSERRRSGQDQQKQHEQHVANFHDFLLAGGRQKMVEIEELFLTLGDS